MTGPDRDSPRRRPSDDLIPVESIADPTRLIVAVFVGFILGVLCDWLAIIAAIALLNYFG